MNPGTESIAKIEKDLVNVFGNELQTTFNTKRKTLPIFSEIVVDMLFTSRDIRVLSKKCPLVDVSDHLPLVIEIES